MVVVEDVAVEREVRKRGVVGRDWRYCRSEWTQEMIHNFGEHFTFR